MKCFVYDKGELIERLNIFPEWELLESYEAYVDRIGYVWEEKIKFGEEFGYQVDIFKSKKEYQFFAWVQLSDAVGFSVFIPDIPSLMTFIKDYCGHANLIDMSSLLNEIMDTLDKLFYVYHGHPSYEICRQCDPEGMKRRSEKLLQKK